MNHSEALTWCFEYDLDDADLNYSLSFDFRDGARVYYEQDSQLAWDPENYSGVFYAEGHPEFPTLLQRVDLPDLGPLTVSALGEFPGRQSTAVRVQLKGSLSEILAYGMQIGETFVVPDYAPATVTYRLVFDYFEGQSSNFGLEIIGADSVDYPNAEEVRTRFLQDLAEKVDPATVFHTMNHVKVALTQDCPYKCKVYYRININE